MSNYIKLIGSNFFELKTALVNQTCYKHEIKDCCVITILNFYF